MTGSFRRALLCVLVWGMTACAVAPTPIQVPYRPLLKTLDRQMGRYDIALAFNSRYPFAETEIRNEKLGAHFAWALALAGPVAGIEVAQRRGRLEQAEAQGRDTVNFDKKVGYDLIVDAQKAFAETFNTADQRLGSVMTTVLDESTAAGSSSADAVLEISIRHSFSPEFQRYNVKANMRLLARDAALKERQKGFYASGDESLYKNTFSYTAVADHVPGASKEAYMQAWQADDGRLTLTVMRESLRALALLVQRDLAALSDAPLQGLAPLEELRLPLASHTLKAERLGSGAWSVNSYTSDLVK